MAKPKVGCVVEAVTPRVYKVWTGAGAEALEGVEGVVAVASLGGDLYVVTVSRRYDVDEVIAEVRQLDEGC